MTTRTRMTPFRSSHSKKAPVCGRQVEVISPGYTILGGRVLQDGMLASRLLQKWLFSPGSKLGWHGSGYEPGQRLSVLGGSHTSIRLAHSLSHTFARCVCACRRWWGCVVGVVRVSTLLP